MTRNDLKQKIENGSDIEREVNGIGLTICTWTENGISISEWNSPETAVTYETAEQLIDGYTIRGVPLLKLIGGVKITDYTANS